jgi:hypothetical protein
MTGSWRSPLLLFGVLCGCSVSATELSPSDLAINQCDDDSICYGGRCVEGTCRGVDGELTSLLIGITSGTVSGVSSVTSFREYPLLSADGGVLDIEVAPAVTIHGTARVDTTLDCLPRFGLGSSGSTAPSGDNFIPVNATFTPTEHVLGVASDTYQARPCTGDIFSYCASVAPGSYSVYLVPYPAAKGPADEDICEIPPRLYLNQAVNSNLKYNLAPASTLRVSIEWPLAPGATVAAAEGMLARWTVDLVEPVSGRLLSNRAELQEPLEPRGSASWTYDTTLRYSPVLVPGKDLPEPTGVGHELIRLTPPEGITAPVLLAEVAGARLSQEPDAPAGIVLKARLPAPVEVEFQTAVAGVPTPVLAGVEFTAKELDGVLGVSTAFSRIVQVDEDGKERVWLLPGRYRVTAVPKDGCSSDQCLGTTLEEWIIPAAPAFQGGKTIQFEVASKLEGYASVATGGPAVGASVRAIASTSAIDSDVLANGDASVEVLPRASAGIVDSGGSFSLEADRGTFDFRVEPDPITGFGWLVQPRVTLPVTDDALSALTVPLPVVYQGRVTLENSASPVSIPGALIRAYVYVRDDGTLSPTRVDGAVAVQVAETYADEDGNYTLLIPRVLGSER